MFNSGSSQSPHTLYVKVDATRNFPSLSGNSARCVASSSRKVPGVQSVPEISDEQSMNSIVS